MATDLLIKGFKPTKESIPPSNQVFRFKESPTSDRKVNFHPLNPTTFILRAALIYPDRVALCHPDTANPVSYTYAVFAQRIQNLAYALINSGIQPGDRVAVIAPNCPMSAEACTGVLAARGILTMINTRLTKSEVDYILKHSGSKLILVDHEFAHLTKGTSAKVVVSKDTGRVGDPYEAFLASGRQASGERGWPGLEENKDETSGAVLCYTSGTTGRPKGVLTTHRGSYLAALACAFEAKMTRESRYLWILPMFHAAGWTFPWANIFSCNTQITLRTVDVDLIWKHLLNSGVTTYCAAPTVQISIVNHQKACRLNRPVTAIIAGAAPTAKLIGELENLGIFPCHVYGLTETYGPFTRTYDQDSWKTLTLEERAKLIARQGHGYATAEEARVVYRTETDEPLKDVPKDGKTVGEIVTNGNIVMKEYFNDPEATKEAFRGGSFHSGDLAVWTEDGVVAIVDRSKDLVISGGENVSSLAVEQELATHPDVLEVSVVARKHPKWGERPMAFIILHDRSRGKWERKNDEFTKDVKKHLRGKLPGFAIPEWIEIVPNLPKTSTGKIVKNELRKIVAKL